MRSDTNYSNSVSSSHILVMVTAINSNSHGNSNSNGHTNSHLDSHSNSNSKCCRQNWTVNKENATKPQILYHHGYTVDELTQLYQQLEDELEELKHDR